MKADDVYQWAPGMASRVIAGKVVIVNTNTNRIISLNETGAEIWALLGEKTVSEIVDELVQVFEVTREQLHSDTVELLEQLKSSGLVTRAGS